MKIRHLVWSVLALILILTLVLPAIFYRQDQEFSFRYYVASVNVSQFADQLDPADLPQLLTDSRAAGATVAVIEERNGQYNEAHLQMAANAGLGIALAPDIYAAAEGQLAQLVPQYNVQYLMPRMESTANGTASYEKSLAIGEIIKTHRLTLVLTERADQKANEEPAGYENYRSAAEGRILRCFRNRSHSPSENGTYPFVYYQFLNSALDRNTRFLMAVPLEDEAFTAQKNAERCLDSMELFCRKMEKIGYLPGPGYGLTAYPPRRTAPYLAAAALMVLMLANMIDLASSKDFRWLLPASIPAAAAAMALTHFLPEPLLHLYPALFAALSPCFCMTVAFRYLKHNCKQFTLMQLLLSVGLFSISMLTLAGSCIAAMMNGWDYWIGEHTLPGMNLTLLLPLLFTFLMLLWAEHRWLTPSRIAPTMHYLRRRLRWYHGVIILLIFAVIGLYLWRNRNVEISFLETQWRNRLTELLLARPRAKEYLFGWPCFILWIYEMHRRGSTRFFQWIFALGTSVLFASSVNTFCNGFTPVETMYYRVVYGLTSGILIGGTLLLLYALFRKLTEKHREVSR